MLNFLVNHLLEYESIVSAVMICLTDGNQKLTRAHTHCDLLKSLNIRVIISNASLPGGVSKITHFWVLIT
ncbi:hypothetical protein MUTS15_30940 [Escherichia coli]|nr:hypothetical protein MUTS15_30940 [Escherichia coli]